MHIVMIIIIKSCCVKWPWMSFLRVCQRHDMLH